MTHLRKMMLDELQRRNYANSTGLDRISNHIMRRLKRAGWKYLETLMVSRLALHR